MAEGIAPSVTDGTGAGLIAFLNWTIEKNELVDATASALRTGCLKVLSVEEQWETLDLRTADLDGLIARFKTRHRLDMKDRTREQYEQRLRQSVEMYLKWLADDPSWKPVQRRRKAADGSAPKVAPADVPANETSVPTVARADVPKPGMISYPFPIRPGLRGKIELPEDLTAREAGRISAFIATLAVEDEPAMLAIEVGATEPWEQDSD